MRIRHLSRWTPRWYLWASRWCASVWHWPVSSWPWSCSLSWWWIIVESVRPVVPHVVLFYRGRVRLEHIVVGVIFLKMNTAWLGVSITHKEVILITITTF